MSTEAMASGLCGSTPPNPMKTSGATATRAATWALVNGGNPVAVSASQPSRTALPPAAR